MDECIAYFNENKVDMILLVYGAFTGDDIACGLADACRCPIVLWAPGRRNGSVRTVCTPTPCAVRP